MGRGTAGRGAGRPPPPGVMPNGLLPPLRAGGRRPGRRPGPGAPGVAGRAGGGPGRGGTGRDPAAAGRSPSAGGSGRAVSRCCARPAWAARTAASCSALSAAARASAAATSMSWALAGLATGAGRLRRTRDRTLRAGPGAGAAGRLGGAGLAETARRRSARRRRWRRRRRGRGAAPPGASTNAPRSRRATGASTVLDADLTNSPISLSLARTVLLSTPSSFASSCTRALPATALLIRGRRAAPAATSLVHLKPDHFRDFIVCSCRSSYLAVRVGRRAHRRRCRTSSGSAHERARPAHRCRGHR